eukprot:CAMPEP_0171380364 /NCGR_PEP_ID=MMETSP0879-20121228/29007_1 /TAXON_ID=67004 /ORGANISM="Thalassiosira weissflogii, Strain CCMP1336" /LENGTH=428 /DNA_ID=CAMNT_0011891419 /DNA_START=10 /DNA_END=1296 /DNA_ORIENTATION=+
MRTIQTLFVFNFAYCIPTTAAFHSSRHLDSGSFHPGIHRSNVLFITRRPNSSIPSNAIHQFNRANAKNSVVANNEDGTNPTDKRECQILLLDHLNINHQKGQHSLLKAFYFDFLKCAIDPRKYENYSAGKKTVWANIGMNQFHLPEGNPEAQVLDGKITLIYESLDGLRERYERFFDGTSVEMDVLKDSKFDVRGIQTNDQGRIAMQVTDPWGNHFEILQSSDPSYDRAAHLGSQPILDGHPPSEGLAIKDLTIHVAPGSNLEGISRFYERIMGASTVNISDSSVSIAVGDRGQTLTFRCHPDGLMANNIRHHDFSFESSEEVDNLEYDGKTSYPMNYGPHISLYISNLPHAYQAAVDLGVLYVNPRFKRRAYTETEAIDQCMFRIIDVVDPLDETKEVILRLEHEVRAVVTRDGKKYKSYPLFEIQV